MTVSVVQITGVKERVTCGFLGQSECHARLRSHMTMPGLNIVLGAKIYQGCKQFLYFTVILTCVTKIFCDDRVVSWQSEAFLAVKSTS